MNIEKLFPEFKDNIWGGTKLKEKYGKKTDKTPCAESWELSFNKDGLTYLSNGKTLCESVTQYDLGTNLKEFPFFPTLIKFIDAKRDLSVQVHPQDDYALKNENSFGKTEMWYVIEAEKGAGIYLGFKRDVTKDELKRAIEEERLTELLNFYEVKAGDSYFIPSGTIHAIGAGCLICEIQQNSNLTYRVYDYGRKDKNGNQRQLHIDKALKVINTKKYSRIELKTNQNLLGASKYFSTKKLVVKYDDGDTELNTDKTTFKSLTCVSGSGRLDNKEINVGDSYFVPANYGKFKVSGNMTLITCEIRKYYIGIDLGGTFIKGGIVDDKGNIVIKDKVPTESDKGAVRVTDNIANLCKNLLQNSNMRVGDILGIGIGVPGMVDSQRGEVIYSNNLKWEHFNIKESVEHLTGLPVKIANDANVAALGESKFGSGKYYSDSVFITLGTGVGGGIISGGKLIEGNHSAGAELGHSVIVAGGELCTCGRRGCLEAYASATAIIRDTKRAMLSDRKSKMWQIGGLDKVTGKTAFDYKNCDKSAKAVVDNYIEKLGVGLTNIANEFRPEVIILGGGVCGQGDDLINPLQKYLDFEIFGGKRGPSVKIITATLGNDAGVLGAAALFMD